MNELVANMNEEMIVQIDDIVQQHTNKDDMSPNNKCLTGNSPNEAYVIEQAEDPELQSTDTKNREEDIKQAKKLDKRERKRTQQYVTNFPEVQKKRKSRVQTQALGEPERVKKVKEVPDQKIVEEIQIKPITVERDLELQPWQIQLQTFQSLLDNLLSQGLPKLVITSDSLIIQQQFQDLKVKLESDDPQPAKQIQKLIALLIENTDYHKSDHQITQDCIEFIKYSTQIEIWPEHILSMLQLQELIVSMKEKKNYYPKTVETQKDISPEFSLKRIFQLCGSVIPDDDEDSLDMIVPSTSLQVQEVIDKDMLSLYCTQQDYQNNRKVRKYFKRLIDSLHKLIILIQKSTKKEQLQKIEEAFKQYVDIKMEKLKLSKEKTKKIQKEKEEKVIKVKEEKPKKIVKTFTQPEKKGNQINNQLKLTDMKKVNYTVPIMQKEIFLEIDREHPEELINDQKSVSSVSPKPSILKDETNKKNQFSILNFFNSKGKKDVQDKFQKTIEIFKSLGTKPNYSTWQSLREQIFETILSHGFDCKMLQEQTISLKDHTIEKDMEIEYSKPTQRKVHIHIFDSKKILKGIKFNKIKTLFNGKQPFRKDEDCIDYDLDSEDEMEELCADNIANSQKDDEEEPDQISESDEMFVVSDGHLSEEEVSDKEDFKRRGKDQVENENSNFQNIAQKAFCYFAQDKTHDELFSQYQVIKIHEDFEFPIKTKKIDETKGTSFFDRDDHTKMLLNQLSGSYFSMQKISQKFKDQNPSCSKYCVERKVKEIGISNINHNIAEKKKGEHNHKDKWFIKPEILEQYGITDEQNQKAQFENEQEFLNNKKQKSDKKKQQQQQQQQEVELQTQTNEQEPLLRYLKLDDPTKIRKSVKSRTKKSDDIIKDQLHVSSIKEEEKHEVIDVE